MKKYERAKFTYTKKDGSVSERDVFLLEVPEDKYYFGIDLSEFAEDERDVYEAELIDLSKYLKKAAEDAIYNLGLSSCYRKFLADGVK